MKRSKESVLIKEPVRSLVVSFVNFHRPNCSLVERLVDFDMVAPLICLAYFALVSMIVGPSAFLAAVYMDYYYHLPSRFNYRIIGPMGHVSTYPVGD